MTNQLPAFEGIRVLDFTHVYAGPFATSQLAVMGAEVIKIEPPDSPDMMRFEGVDEELNQQGLGTGYLFNNQGKRAITLNLNCEKGREIAYQLIETADVLVENYSAGLARYGLSSQQAHIINPGLIYCNMSAYDPDSALADRPAFDPVIQAMSGMMSVNGDADQEYMRVGPPLVDYGTGAQAAFAIAAALYQRHHSGKGQVINVNMLDAALMMMSPLVTGVMYNGKTVERSGNIHARRPGYSAFQCSDDNLMVGAFTLQQHIRLFKAVLLDELMDLPQVFDNAWIGNNAALLREKMLVRFAEHTTDYWETVLNENDVPAARVRDLTDTVLNDQDRRATSSQYQRVENNDLTAPIAAFSFAEAGPRLDRRCAKYGEDTDAVLTEMGYSDDDLEHLREQAVIG
ncbi:MAG: CoA transferase [Gammaproteobacteria bacterium]|nr:CoA transferase [Gammaproteobacteria bacterium]